MSTPDYLFADPEPLCDFCYREVPLDSVRVLGRGYCSWRCAFDGEIGWLTPRSVRRHTRWLLERRTTQKQAV